VIDDPLNGLRAAAATLDLDSAQFVGMNANGDPASLTRLAACTWWWRAYYERGAASPRRGMFGKPFRRFRLAYADRPVMVWERMP
jgi:hypothetical protein